MARLSAADRPVLPFWAVGPAEPAKDTAAKHYRVVWGFLVLHIVRKIAVIPVLGCMALVFTPASPVSAQEVSGNRVSCASSPTGGRTNCPADTSAGVVLTRSKGTAACLLGKSWGYDDNNIWVSDGCSAEFLAGQVGKNGEIKPASTESAPDYVPNGGFKIYDGENGQIYMRLMTYVRYLNQNGLDATYTDYFGNTKTVDKREDVQLNKFFLPFSGWFLTPKMRYYLYVWSSNPSQGEPAQVVGGGNISWVFNRFVTMGGGITSLPSVRSTEGQFPYWLGVDDRLIADEFFRGSYTSGVWVKGELTTTLKYNVMFGNNLSTLGVSASQLDNKFDTQAYSVQWLPTTGEFGLWGTFGDYDDHQKVATRVGLHFTHSVEEKQSQPGTEGIENSQIRLTDGSVIFTPDLFGPGITVNEVDYRMASLDAGVKDTGYQLQTSAMVVPKTLQLYFGASQIFGDYGDPWEVRVGQNWYLMKERGIRLNGEWMYVEGSPVGYTAYPYPVGAKGQVFHINLELNF